MVKVFITKFVLTRGIYESKEGEIREDHCFSSPTASYPNAFLRPKEYRLRMDEAIRQAEGILIKKIEYHQQELQRLNKLTFNK